MNLRDQYGNTLSIEKGRRVSREIIVGNVTREEGDESWDKKSERQNWSRGGHKFGIRRLGARKKGLQGTNANPHIKGRNLAGVEDKEEKKGPFQKPMGRNKGQKKLQSRSSRANYNKKRRERRTKK